MVPQNLVKFPHSVRLPQVFFQILFAFLFILNSFRQSAIFCAFSTISRCRRGHHTSEASLSIASPSACPKWIAWSKFYRISLGITRLWSINNRPCVSTLNEFNFSLQGEGRQRITATTNSLTNLMTFWIVLSFSWFAWSYMKLIFEFAKSCSDVNLSFQILL